VEGQRLNGGHLTSNAKVLPLPTEEQVEEQKHRNIHLENTRSGK